MVTSSTMCRSTSFGSIIIAMQVALALSALMLLVSAVKPRIIRVTAGLVLLLILPPLLGGCRSSPSTGA